MNILNRNNWEIYNKITIYSDPNNHNNDYAIINYEVYKPYEVVKEYTKVIPSYLINQAINEFEYQKRNKLIPVKELDIKNIIIEKAKEESEERRKKIRKIIKITSICIAIGIIGTVGYFLNKNGVFDNKNSITYDITNDNTYEKDLNVLYSNPFSYKESLEKSYFEYRKNKDNIEIGNYNDGNIDDYIKSVEELVNEDIFFEISGFKGYHFLQYTIGNDGHVNHDSLYSELSYFKGIEENRKEYLQEQCRYLFYEYNPVLNDIKIRNTNPISISDNKKIYYIPEDIQEYDADNSYLLTQINSLIQLRKIVINDNYTYTDKNEKGVVKIYAYNDEILEKIDNKLEQLKTILKIRCMNKTI